MKVSHSLFCAAIVATTASAFVVPIKSCSLSLNRRRNRHNNIKMVSGMGWDNDNFMDSLGKGQQDRQRANEDYYRRSRYGRPDDNENNYENSSDTNAASHNPEPAFSPQDDNNDNNNNGEDDNLPSGDITGAALTEEMKERIKASHDAEEQASQGGQMFKNLLERAQQGGLGGGQQASAPRVPPPPPLQQVFPPPPPPPPQQQQQQQQQMPADLNNLSVEEQARLFREMMAQQQTGAPPLSPDPYPQQQQQQQQQPQQPQHFMGPGIGPDGRKIGRNKDADAIVNSADLYFAQLKRDSTTRNYARYAGDDERANAVFHDPSIQQIKMHVNPYLQEQKEKEKDLLETVPEEMIIFQEYGENQPKQPKNFAGISYKEKLAAQKARATGQAVPSLTQREINAQKAAEEERLRFAQHGDVPRAIPAVPEEYIAKFVPATEPQSAIDNARPKPNPSMNTFPTRVEEVVSQPPTPPPPPTTTPEMTTTVSTTTPKITTTQTQQPVLTGDTRRDIRTLMGLILKHRGGPGFGAGRLQGTEAEQLEALAKAIPGELNQEEPQVDDNNINNIVQASSQAMAAVQSDRVPSMIACIEGAITMYKNSPAELQGSVLVTLRAALLAALQTLSEVIENRSSTMDTVSTETSIPPPVALSAQQSQNVLSMLAVIEGAITMYKNSPEALQGSILGTLNAALMSAVNTCNEILVSGSVAASAPAAPAEQAANVAAPVGEVPPLTAESTTLADLGAPQYSGNDPNTIMLEGIYDQITNAGGDGKMGLQPDLSADEAQNLRDSLEDMRTLLVDELHSGISEGEDSSSIDEIASSDMAPPAPSPGQSSSTSMYKQMLAKARAEKESNGGFQ